MRESTTKMRALQKLRYMKVAALDAPLYEELFPTRKALADAISICANHAFFTGMAEDYKRLVDQGIRQEEEDVQNRN